jgi:hypothetical protein
VTVWSLNGLPFDRIATGAVAAMKVHGVTHVLPFNADDFKRFDGIETTRPEDVGVESEATDLAAASVEKAAKTGDDMLSRS